MKKIRGVKSFPLVLAYVEALRRSEGWPGREARLMDRIEAILNRYGWATVKGEGYPLEGRVEYVGKGCQMGTLPSFTVSRFC